MDKAPYLELIEKTAAESLQAPAAGSPAEQAMIARFLEFFGDLSPQRVQASVRDVYAANACLFDTLVLHQGIDAIAPYFAKTAKRARGVRVRSLDLLRKEADFYLKWSMEIDWSAFRSGTTTSYGISHLRFNAAGQIILHYDFWDSANGFFEHIPIVGWLIRLIKRRV